MTEIDLSQLNLVDHDHCDHSHAINQSRKPIILPVFDQSNNQSTFARRLSVKDLPILSVNSPIKLNAITQSINQSNDQSIDQSIDHAVKELLKLFLQCQSERSQIYSVFESAFTQYIAVVQSSKQSDDHNQSIDNLLVEQSLKDYSELCARISVLFKHCSMNIKSIINQLSSINQPNDQSNSNNQSVDQSINQLQKIQLFEQSKLALTIHRQDAISQFIHSKQSSHPSIKHDFDELINQLRLESGEVIVGINEVLEEIREYVYED